MNSPSPAAGPIGRPGTSAAAVGSPAPTPGPLDRLRTADQLLAGVAELPPAEQAQAFERIHAELAAALAGSVSADRPAPPGSG